MILTRHFHPGKKPAMTATPLPVRCTAFAGTRRLAAGAPAEVAVAVRAALDAGETAAVLVFDDDSGAPVDFDLRGDVAAVHARYAAQEPAAAAPAAKRGPGRPRLGVVTREVGLLPRHWDWLAAQPGGASAALRRLVEQARRNGAGADRRRQARDATYRVMAAIAGDLPGFEEAARALFAGDPARFAQGIEAWPGDVRAYLAALAAAGFD
jgi:hypothetical protein